MLKSTILSLLCSGLICFVSCIEDPLPDFDRTDVLGYRPIYAQSDEVLIKIQPSKPITEAGKIYSYGNLLLVNRPQEGVHVINNSNPANPINLFFLTIPGNDNILVKDNLLYADSYSDLVVLEVVTDTVKEVNRIKNIIESLSDELPPGNDVYFDCVKPELGVVVAWESAILKDPDCYKP